MSNPVPDSVAARIARAPWSEEQVVSLNERQACGHFHPYTCVAGHGELIAFTTGWVCAHEDEQGRCPYFQDWAWRFDTDGQWRDAVLSREQILKGGQHGEG